MADYLLKYSVGNDPELIASDHVRIDVHPLINIERTIGVGLPYLDEVGLLRCRVAVFDPADRWFVGRAA